MKKYTWKRYGGYECSSKGDIRCSAFNAVMYDGRTLEEHYQCDVKGYDPGGTDWRAGKGKPALDPETDLWKSYLGLWKRYVSDNPTFLADLEISLQGETVLSDMFATTPVNQAHALAVLLNERIGYVMCYICGKDLPKAEPFKTEKQEKPTIVIHYCIECGDKLFPNYPAE